MTSVLTFIAEALTLGPAFLLVLIGRAVGGAAMTVEFVLGLVFIVLVVLKIARDERRTL